MTDPADKTYRRTWFSWALYDVGNSAFWLVVVATVFPVYYQNLYVEAHKPAGALEEKAKENLLTQGAASLALAATIAMIVVAVMGPILGTIADRAPVKKRLLAAFAGLGVVSTGLMSLFGSGSLAFGAALYILGTIGVAGSMVFYDALLPSVAREKDLDRISSIGFAAGYLGSTLLFVLNFLMMEHPGWFGLADSGAAVRVSFVTVAVWWALFTIPILRKVPEPPVATTGGGNRVLEGFRQLGRTFREVRHYRQLLLFLAAFWVYSDGIGTIIKMAAPFGKSIGVPTRHLMQALIVTQIVGVPCALAFGALARRIGAKTGILMGLAVYTGICVGANFMSETWHFYALAVSVGLVQGGTQALSRSLFASMVPAGKTGEFFGFFSTMEKFAGIIGPLLLFLLWRGEDPDPRRGILVLAVLFVVGGLILWRVDVGAARKAALPPAA